MAKTFLEFVENKKKSPEDEGGALTSRVSLGDGNDFPPLLVSDDPNSEHYGKNKALAPLIRAFKKGANWGWSKDDGSGEDKPVKVGTKKLFMTGGALRDHLAGKKSRNTELATNCSPDETYHILTQNDFEFIGDESEIQGVEPGTKQYFWIKKKDKEGRPYVFGIKIKNDEFELSVFAKNGRAKDGDLKPGNHADDASSRDFTINGMYLVLANDNGPNKEVHDFHGGMHHLKSGRIASIGNMDEKLQEDPVRALRYARMLARYGDIKKVPLEEKESIKKASEHLGKIDPKDAMDEFMRGLNYEDVDARSYLKTYSDLGLMGAIFPGLNLDTKLPKELRELGDKHAPIAWMLRHHDPKQLEGSLSANWKPEDLKKIVFLIKSLNIDDGMDEDSLEDMTKSYMSSGVSGRKLKQWVTKLGGKDEGLVDTFLTHAQSPRVKVHTASPDGTEEVAEGFKDIVDPFSGELRYEDAECRKKELELQNFRSLLNKKAK